MVNGKRISTIGKGFLAGIALGTVAFAGLLTYVLTHRSDLPKQEPTKSAIVRCNDKDYEIEEAHQAQITYGSNWTSLNVLNSTKTPERYDVVDNLDVDAGEGSTCVSKFYMHLNEERLEYSGCVDLTSNQTHPTAFTFYSAPYFRTIEGAISPIAGDGIGNQAKAELSDRIYDTGLCLAAKAREFGLVKK